MKKIIPFLIKLIFFSIFVSSSYAADPETEIICIYPEVVLPGHTITILGTDFGEKTKTSSVIFSHGLDTTDGKIIEWTDTKIIAIVPIVSLIPPDAEQQWCEVSVKRKQGEDRSNLKPFTLLLYKGENFLVNESIKLKESGVSDQAIIEHLFHTGKSLSDKDPEVEGVFGNTKLTASSIKKLKDAGFQDDFMPKMRGDGREVTVGIAAIWLFTTADLVPSPLIRVFLKPRSYFSARKPFHKRIFSLKSYDLNFGYTTTTPTSKDSTLAEKKSYVLAGFSFEITRAALLNFGVAAVPGDVEGKERQLYMGLTIDQNFLKDIGIMKK